MRLLFDEDTPEQLMRHFQPHTCTHVNRTQFKGLKNGTLLAAASADYDTLITADSNLYHQQFVAGFDIAVAVLRAWRTRLEFLLPAVPAALETLESIQPGEVRYHYADELSEQKDRRKGKGPFRIS
jgi:predicted nuclease of predicted toxin-antitoxin system